MSSDADESAPGQPGLLVIARGWGIERTVTLARAKEVGGTVQKWLAEILGERDHVQPSG